MKQVVLSTQEYFKIKIVKTPNDLFHEYKGKLFFNFYFFYSYPLFFLRVHHYSLK